MAIRPLHDKAQESWIRVRWRRRRLAKSPLRLHSLPRSQGPRFWPEEPVQSRPYQRRLRRTLWSSYRPRKLQQTFLPQVMRRRIRRVLPHSGEPVIRLALRHSRKDHSFRERSKGQERLPVPMGFQEEAGAGRERPEVEPASGVAEEAMRDLKAGRT